MAAAANPSAPSTFTVPYVGWTFNLNWSRPTHSAMVQTVADAQRTASSSGEPGRFEQMKSTAAKIIPIALTVILFFATSPVWMPCMSICSSIFGIGTWFVVPFATLNLYQLFDRMVISFRHDQEIPFNYVAVRLNEVMNWISPTPAAPTLLAVRT